MATKQGHDSARRAWLPSSQPEWLDNKAYTEKVQPRLAKITYSAIASALGISAPYAADVRADDDVPTQGVDIVREAIFQQ